MSAVCQERTLEVSIINDVYAERETLVSFWRDNDISSEKVYTYFRSLSLASSSGRRYQLSRFAIFSESGRAEAGDGDFLEQVRAGHDG